MAHFIWIIAMNKASVKLSQGEMNWYIVITKLIIVHILVSRAFIRHIWYGRSCKLYMRYGISNSNYSRYTDNKKHKTCSYCGRRVWISVLNMKTSVQEASFCIFERYLCTMHASRHWVVNSDLFARALCYFALINIYIYMGRDPDTYINIDV